MRKVYCLNLFLFFIVVLLSLRLHDILSNSIEIPSSSLYKHEATKLRAEKIKRTSQLKSRVPEFRVISEKTIFHPDRTITKKPDIISAPVLLPMIKPILVGTVISANGAKAYFSDPTTKITKPYRVDDSVFGYKVQDIGDSKVILSSGNRKVELNLGKVENVQGTQEGNTRKRIYGNQLLKRLFQSYDETPLPASMSSGSKKK